MPAAKQASRADRTLAASELILSKHREGMPQSQIPLALSGIRGVSRSSVKRTLRYAHTHQGEPRPSQQGKGRMNDVRWIFAGPEREMRLRLLQRVKCAGDAA